MQISKCCMLCYYFPMVYIIPIPNNMPATILQQDIPQNKPKVSQLTNLDIKSSFTKRFNAPRNVLSLLWWQVNRVTTDVTPILWGNNLRSKVG